uniref:Uncharacterized protein n=1 Tax=Helianthus annuus TaxID=4232 RepID=A0A251VCF1_HELAN
MMLLLSWIKHHNVKEVSNGKKSDSMKNSNAAKMGFDGPSSSLTVNEPSQAELI